MSGSEITKTTNLFYCPKCGSQNVAAVYSVPVNLKVWIEPTPPKDRCQSCRHEDLRGHFEILNLQKIREKKIESILDGIKI